MNVYCTLTELTNRKTYRALRKLRKGPRFTLAHTKKDEQSQYEIWYLTIFGTNNVFAGFCMVSWDIKSYQKLDQRSTVNKF